MSWRQEFGEAYEIPRFIDYLVDQGVLEDLSARGEIEPSFGLQDELLDFEARLWVGHPFQSEREDPEAARFLVTSGSIQEEEEYFWELYDELEDSLGGLFKLIGTYYTQNPHRERGHSRWRAHQEFLGEMFRDYYEERIIPSSAPPPAPTAREWEIEE